MELGANKLSFSFAQATGTDFDRSLYLPVSERRRAVDRIDRVHAMFSLECFRCGTDYVESPLQMCDMWSHRYLHVDYRGRLTLCCQFSGIPGESPHGDVAGDLHDMSLAEAHDRFTDMVHQTLRARLRAIRQPDIDDLTRHVPCNWCLAYHGRPYWTEGGSAGPRAARARRKPGPGAESARDETDNDRFCPFPSYGTTGFGE